MKRYFYHVTYYRSGKGSDGVGDCAINTARPIKTKEDIDQIREIIKTSFKDGANTVVILGFTLLRIEDAEPEEVATT